MVLAITVGAMLVPWTSASGTEITGYAAGEFRLFFQSPAYPEQHGSNVSFALQPELYHDWARGDQSITATPFLRLDQGDPERTHIDVRELFYLGVFGAWEFRAGLKKIFWGVTESNHLVDIINQTDLVENIDREDKLGQPMVDISLVQLWGIVDLFILPGFRERTFPGREGRLRSEPYVDTDQAVYESAAEQGHVDWSLRWAHALGAWDIGVAHFSGTGRDPSFLPGLDGEGAPVLVPFYEQIDQSGLDLQMTQGGWLWKFETLHRTGQGEGYWAFAGGFEYTWGSMMESNLDLGVLAEYHYDNRTPAAPVPFDDDVFLGTRLAFNDVQDTQILAGVILDRRTDAAFFNVEANRRVGDRWRLDVEIRSFFGTASSDLLHSLRKDDYVQVELARYF